MFVLFINGLGLTTFSGWLLLRRLRSTGCTTGTFAYSVSLESFESIVARLRIQLEQIAARGEYVVVGHSLGGVLMRAAINSMPPDFVPPRLCFLIGSPLSAPRLAQRFKDNRLWGILGGDCGQLVGTPERMNSIGALSTPTTAIVGISGLTGRWSPFGNEMNDSSLAVSEATAPWLTDIVEVTALHTFMPFTKSVATIISQRLAKYNPMDYT